MIDTAIDGRKQVERAFLVGAYAPDKTSEAEVMEHLDELGELVANLGIGVVEKRAVAVKKINSQYYLGKGQAENLVHEAQMLEADCLVFDDPLSPSQQRNWERLSQLCVVDREEIILDIFADRASTKEAVLQVELARLQYFLPRLTRAWTHLSRQRGGAKGTRGEGETQIENDRRMLKHRIAQLQKDLQIVRQQRDTTRKGRSRHALAQGAIVGYTNVGKSSLLKALSGADVLVENKLFATLDPTTRKIRLPNHQELLLTDTVGFVRKLPHSLVEAFKSTLEEALLADFLILMLDVSSPHLFDQWETTLQVLHELGASDKDILVVFNKIDLVDDADELLVTSRARLVTNKGFFLSTKSGKNLDVLVNELSRIVAEQSEAIKVVLPPERSDLAALAHRQCSIISEQYLDNGVIKMELNVPPEQLHKFKLFIESESTPCH